MNDPHVSIRWMRLYIYFLSLISVGHTGIGDSQGVIHDFAGPYHINIGSLAFGRTTRYLQLSPDQCHLQDWDMGVKEGCEIYKGRNHNLILDNCHSHVAKCLNTMGYSKYSLITQFSHFLSFSPFIWTRSVSAQISSRPELNLRYGQDCSLDVFLREVRQFWGIR